MPTTGAVADALRASLGQGRMPFLEITSDSMTPLLRRGDQVGLAATAPEQLQRGDIVTFLENEHLTTHRYWGQMAGRLLSRADRSGAFDRPWLPQALVGRVVVRRRAGAGLWLDAGAGRQLNRLLFRWCVAGQRLSTLGLPRRLVRAAWLAFAVPAAAVGAALAGWERPSDRPEEQL